MALVRYVTRDRHHYDCTSPIVCPMPDYAPSSHHSVRIQVRYVDNIKTLYRLRRASGRPPDCT
jgi:hypothetical protein